MAILEKGASQDPSICCAHRAADTQSHAWEDNQMGLVSRQKILRLLCEAQVIVFQKR